MRGGEGGWSTRFHTITESLTSGTMVILNCDQPKSADITGIGGPMTKRRSKALTKWSKHTQNSSLGTNIATASWNQKYSAKKNTKTQHSVQDLKKLFDCGHRLLTLPRRSQYDQTWPWLCPEGLDVFVGKYRQTDLAQYMRKNVR